MVQSKATTVQDYLAELDPDRRDIIEEVLATVRASLPAGYVEAMRWGMISWEIPLEDYPNTYNGQPLSFAGLASQKDGCSLYLMCVYADDDDAERFKVAYRATGKRMDMGKSCVRFKKVDDLPLGLIAETIAAVPPEVYIARYEASRHEATKAVKKATKKAAAPKR